MKYFFRHILIVAFCCFSVCGFSQNAKDLDKRKADTEKEIANLDKKLSEKTKEKQTKTDTIKLLNRRIDQRKKLIKDTDIQISITEKEINKLTGKINEIRSKLTKMKDAYSELVVNVYINRKKATWLMYVFASEDISQAYRRLKYLQSYRDVVLVQAKKIEETTQNLGKEIILLGDKKQDLDEYKSERKKEIELLAKDETAAKRMLEGLKKEEDKIKKELQAKQQTLEKLNKEIAKRVEKEVEKSKSTGYAKTPENIKLSNNFSANRGHLPWPVKQGNIVGFFGNHSHPVHKHIQQSNTGIDIETPAGENVLAAFDGTVSNVFVVTGMNFCIMLKHGDYFTLYCRLGSVSVKAGDNVKTGTVLGKLVATGQNDSQLHFELWKEKTNLNPQLWLAKR